MGFKATEAVEELTYDFHPHVKVAGTIPEPSSKQIEDFRERLISSVKATGLNPEALHSGNVSMEQVDELLDKADGIEEEMLSAVADLTGIAHDTLRALPHRIKSAFMGWVVGQFLNPEA